MVTARFTNSGRITGYGRWREGDGGGPLNEGREPKGGKRDKNESSLGKLDAALNREIRERFYHRNIKLEVAEFARAPCSRR